MKRLEALRPYAGHLSALGIAIVLGLAVAAVKLSSTPPAVDTADRWPFPQWAPYRTGPQRDVLARAEIWTADPSKTKAAVAEKKPEGPPWRFIGTVQDGKARVAVIELEQGKRVQRIANGDPLPNGAVIKKIDISELIYDENGVEKVLKLFSAANTVNPAAGNGKN
jgi:hypothetical protein